MADIKYVISADVNSARLEMGEWNATLKDSSVWAASTSGVLGDLWKQFAAGQLVADAARKIMGTFWGELKSTVTADLEDEEAQKNLDLALASTGRTVEAMLPKLSDYATEIMKQTKYDDDAVKGAQALLVQLTNLNERGLQEAIRGVVGLSTVYGGDLQSNARLVAQAYEGNYMALGKLIPAVRDAKTETEKHAAMQGAFVEMFSRATGEVNTFSGSLEQLKNWWDEIKSSVGKAITENEGIRKIIQDVKEQAIKLIEEGKIEEWAANASQTITSLVGNLRDLYNVVEKATGFVSDAYVTMKTAANDLSRDQEAMNIVLWGTLDGYQDWLEAGKDVEGEMAIVNHQLWALTEKFRDHDVVLDEAKGKHEKLQPAINETGNAARRASGEVSKFRQWQIDLANTITDVAIPAMKELRLVDDYVATELRTTVIPAARDMRGVVEQAVPEDVMFRTTNYFNSFQSSAKKACDTTKGHFDGLYNDIARSMGQHMGDFVGEVAKGLDFAHGEFFKGGIKFKKLFGDIFGDIKDIAFRKLGEIAANEILDKITGLFKKAGDVGKDTMEGAAKDAVKGAGDIVKGASVAISGLWTGLGAAVGTFLGTLIGGGGGLGKKEGGWIHETRDRAYDIMHTLDNMFANHEDIRANYWPSMTGTLEEIKLAADTGFGALEGWLSTIEGNTRSLRDLKSAAAGANFYAPKAGLLAYHGGERVIVQNNREVVRESGSITIPLYIGAEKFTDIIVDTVKRQAQIGRLRVPAKMVPNLAR